MIQFSVIMPTYNQVGYIRNAIRSLFMQTYDQWELIIVNDGSTDWTEEFIQDYIADERVTYLKNEENLGLGAAINKAMDIAKYDYIAYLPSDDFFLKNHLQMLKEVFEINKDVVLAYTEMRSEVSDSLLYHKNSHINGLVKQVSLQLVQTAHMKTTDRWVERSKWVSEDLYKTFWHKLIGKGSFYYINEITCQWTIHPFQRYKIISETFGGHINRYRQYYKVQDPIRMKVSENKFTDEVVAYAPYHSNFSAAKDGLKILLVGELSYNPERIYALEEAGHKLYGLWTQTPSFSFSNVGHLPFGHVEDLDYEHWEEEIRRVKPDVIYGLLNFCAVSIAYDVLRKFPDIPFVWHFKEGPFLCFEHELWNKLVYLYHKADGKIFLNEELRQWYEQYIPKMGDYLVLDGDLPKKDYFKNDFSAKLSSLDGEIHTVVAGRIVGLTIDDIKMLADNRIHLHLYTESYEASKVSFNIKAMQVAPCYFHIHKHCSPENWTKEFSQYDAGWLHCFDSKNNGVLSDVSWNDLNLPARISTMMVAGIPTIQKDNWKHIVAMQSCVKDIGCGIFYRDMEDLAKQLYNKRKMVKLQANVKKHRLNFSFDRHVPELVNYFRSIINKKKNNENNTKISFA